MTAALRLCAFLSAWGAALLLGSAPAVAHTRLVGTEPGADTTVTEELAAVVLHFSEAVNQTIGEVTVVAPDGSAVEDGAVHIDGAWVEQRLTALPATGEYTVSFRVVASDGHPLTGEFAFTYDGPVPAEEPEPTPEPEPDAQAAEEHEPHGEHEHEDHATGGAAPLDTDRHDGATSAPASVAVASPPWHLLVLAAVALAGLLVAGAYAVLAVVRWQPET